MQDLPAFLIWHLIHIYRFELTVLYGCYFLFCTFAKIAVYE